MILPILTGLIFLVTLGLLIKVCSRAALARVRPR